MLPTFFTFTALTTWFKKPIVAATVVVTYLGQFALVWISWGIWSRDRPDLIANGLAAPSLPLFSIRACSGPLSPYMACFFYLWF